MRYIALLRGINVGGKNPVPMAELKTVCESAGMSDVRTYINSGNVVFSAVDSDPSEHGMQLGRAIEAHFGFTVAVLVLDLPKMRRIVGTLPPDWVNDQAMRCDVMFLWPAVDAPQALESIEIRPGIEDLVYTPGALIWRVDRSNVTKSRVPRIIGTPLYQQLTGRNCNTARKLLELMEQTG